MSNWRSFAALVACGVGACAGWTRAADLAPNPQQALSLTPTIHADDQPRQPLMHMLDEAGVASDLDEWGINIGGVAEASYTYNFQNPDTGFNAGRGFDIENEDPTLNQIDLFVERGVSASPTHFDLGGRIEWIFGGDARFIHSNGLMDNVGFRNGPETQFDPVQLYVKGNIPVGNGILVTAGKFVSPLGYETIDPSTNNFYSHSFEFFFSTPFTFSGVTAKYAPDKDYSFTLGIVRGWDQSVKDNNDVVSYLGQFEYSIDQITFDFNLITGPEETNDNGNYRTLFDVILAYRPVKDWTFAANVDYGFESLPTGGRTDSWWAIAGYATYKLDEMFTLQARAEYFDDKDGVRGIGTQLGEITAGVNIKPFPNDEYGSGLMFRPEFRVDLANNSVFNSGQDDTQTTFAIDALYVF